MCDCLNKLADPNHLAAIYRESSESKPKKWPKSIKLLGMDLASNFGKFIRRKYQHVVETQTYSVIKVKPEGRKETLIQLRHKYCPFCGKPYRLGTSRKIRVTCLLSLEVLHQTEYPKS